MEKFMSFFEKHIATHLIKISNNKYLRVVSRAFMASMPLSIAGAFFTMLLTLPLGEWYTNFLASSNLGTYLSYPQQVTTDVLALVIAFTIAYSLAKEYKEDALTVGIISLCSFLLLTPFNTSLTLDDGTVHEVLKVIPTMWLGAQGLFVAIITGIFVTEVYHFCIKRNWYIKMPAGVPENVATPFRGLVPCMILLITFLLVRVGLEQTPFGNLHQLVYGLLQIPLQSLGNNIITFVICTLLMQLLWMVGVHGPLTVISVMLPVWTAAQTENLTAVLAGGEPTNIISISYYMMYGNFMGGSGNTLGLVILMAFFAKSKQFRTLGKLSLGPGIFNINEPITFGLPVVMNPIAFIPFVFTPVIVAILAYIFTKIGFLGILPGINTPSQVPIIIKAFFAGGETSVRIAIFQVAMFILCTAIWYPFFKIMDKEAYEQEQSAIVPLEEEV